MDASEVSETVSEISEDNDDAGGIDRQWVAIFISVLAVVLAITAMGGSNATKDMMNSNIIASNTYSFYQAKTIRQTAYKLAADELLAIKATSLWLPDAAANLIDQRLESYKSAVERYESEPSTGEGKKELLAKAAEFEAIRDRAARQDPFFDYGEALLQISIVLASASMVARRRWVLWLAYFFASVALMLTANAFFLWVDMPF
ncbi:MAG: DUF4337 domain-containing protein [Rhodospirillaceae bacterium]